MVTTPITSMAPSNNAYKCTLSLTHNYLASGVSWFLAKLHESSPDKLGKAKIERSQPVAVVETQVGSPSRVPQGADIWLQTRGPRAAKSRCVSRMSMTFCSFQGLDENISKASRSYLAGWGCLTQARTFNSKTSLGALKKHRRQEHCLFSGQRSNPKSKPECPRSPNFQNYPLPPVPT